jgi:Pyruvate/2-oxoacid:ferredoxin oxidoreductase delta subunit
VAREAVEADVLINLAKLKTHMQMLLTLGVKNMFGCIVGLTKPQWHLRAGVDRDKFARLLVQLYQALQPAMTIVDGVLALEGQGPGKSGTPRQLGILVGSRSAWATDRMICKALGLEPERVPTLRVAQAMGLIPQDEIYIKGDFHIIHDFNLPVLKPLTYGPPYLHQFMRKHLLQKPVVNPQVCILCGKCQQYCPARVIEQDRNGVRFDYDRCIRCYCCAEVCPEGAIRVIEPLAGKIVNKVFGTKP